MKRVVVFVVLAMVVVGYCAAQSASSDAQRIVGTWTLEASGIAYTWVFNANGTLTVTMDGKSENRKYGISASGVLYLVDNNNSGGEIPLYISPDGRRMILVIVDGRNSTPMVFQKK